MLAVVQDRVGLHHLGRAVGFLDLRGGTRGWHKIVSTLVGKGQKQIVRLDRVCLRVRVAREGRASSNRRNTSDRGGGGGGGGVKKQALKQK